MAKSAGTRRDLPKSASHVRPVRDVNVPLALMESPRRGSQSRLRADGRKNSRVRPARNAILQTVSSAPEPKPVVVVPVHKATPTKLEVISLRQCGKCLAAKDILLLAPSGLDLAKYRELMLITGEIRVEPHWMESRPAYNRLMISPLVYEDLQGYTHVLIHEPDALVVRDELDYWCLQPYDYIGAPWFDGYNVAAIDAPILGVGNFGFSLLRLESMKKTIRSWRRWYPFDQIGRDMVKGLLGHRDRLRRGIGGLGSGGRLRGASRLYSSHCDIFWSQTCTADHARFQGGAGSGRSAVFMGGFAEPLF